MIDPFNVIVHRCSAMRSLVAQARQVAGDRGTVLIEGEFGTGKELLARAIHATSSVSAGPFIVINCGAIPELLLESEMFGHMQGGFTPSAHRTRPGQFERAAGGTVFLDEILELPLSVQLKLLEVLGTKSVVPVGGRAPRPVDIRLISASSQGLDPAVGKGQFDRSLRDRLADHYLWVPPLRERVGDVELLVDHLLTNPVSWLEPEARKGLTHEGLARLCAHLWPGNVRELRSVLEAAFVRAGARRVIETRDIHFLSERR